MVIFAYFSVNLWNHFLDKVIGICANKFIHTINYFSRYPSPAFWYLANADKKRKDSGLRTTSTLPQVALSSAFTISEKMSMDGFKAPTNRQCTWTYGKKNPHLPPPILSHIGDCSSPGTIKKVTYEETNISCRNWCSRYSQVCLEVPYLLKCVPICWRSCISVLYNLWGICSVCPSHNLAAVSAPGLGCGNSPSCKHHDASSLQKLYMNYIHCQLENLHLKLSILLICWASFSMHNIGDLSHSGMDDFPLAMLAGLDEWE